MAEAFVQVAPDSTGAKLHTVSKVVGANTVHNQVVIPTSPRTRVGFYFGSSGLITLAAAADAATAGKLWLVNPTTSTTAVALKRVKVSTQGGGALAATTPIMITAERCLLTGTLTATPIIVAPRVRTAIQGETADPSIPVAKLITATTGLTMTASATARSFLSVVSMSATATGTYSGPGVEVWDPDEEGSEFIMAPGEGVVFRQSAGVTSETRRLTIDLAWEEFTAA